MKLDINNFTRSPFDNSTLINDEGVLTQFYNPPYIDKSSCDLHTLKEGETLQELAAFQYGDSGLWYIIAEANNILNPFKELKPGMILLIPTSYVV